MIYAIVGVLIVELFLVMLAIILRQRERIRELNDELDFLVETKYIGYVESNDPADYWKYCDDDA